MTIRLVHFVTGTDGDSHFTVGEVEWTSTGAVSSISTHQDVHSLSFEETVAGSSLDWHTAPARQYVITLSGTLEFEMRDGSTVTITPGDILLAEDTTGSGHRWRLVGDQPWRRVYVTLA